MGIMPDSRLCLMLGNYNYNKNFNKGHKFLLQAFTKVVNQIPNVYLLICGHGSPEDIKDIKRMTGDFGLNNHVYLSHFRDDISSILQASDILLVSAQVFESFGFAIIEAMANQIPVVATNVGAIPEILLDGQGGYCVGKTDVDNYASHIINLLKDNKLRKSQGQKGFARYNKLFTASRMAQEYAKLICSNE
jgi:glycosyltransferase involved in cell wall biosynthesis